METMQLRAVEDADLPVFFADQVDVEVCRMVGTVPRARDAFDAHWAKTRADPAVLLRTMVLGDEIVG